MLTVGSKTTISGRLCGSFVALIMFAGLLGCTTDSLIPDNLLLQVSMDAGVENPTSAKTLRIRMRSRTTGEVIPSDETASIYNIDISGKNLATTPYVVEILPDKFSGNVDAQFLALTQSGDIVAAHSGVINIETQEVVDVILLGSNACDQDGDGTINCDVAGCCPEGTSPVEDCDDDHATANVFASEDECSECGNDIDEDCTDGDLPCVDTDEDGSYDNCGDCAPEDDEISPDLPELCDGKDNNCDNNTDEGFQYTSSLEGILPLDSACGVGACAGGTVECNDTNDGAYCNTPNEPSDEICGNDIDDDCDNLTDEGCLSDDQDGDGVADPDDCPDYPMAKYHSEFYPGADEPCCAADLEGTGIEFETCDRDCDGAVTFCDPDDSDGDGIAAGLDCDDDDPLTHPALSSQGIEAPPENCNDGIAQDCAGGSAKCDTGTDNDGDGYLNGQGDCNDNDANIHPGAVELCNNIDDNCDDIIDDGNPETGGTWISEDFGMDIPCHPDGEVTGTTGACKPGTYVCVHGYTDPETNEVSTLHQCLQPVIPMDEICDSEDIDEDCDGNFNDLNALECTTFYRDEDDDTFGVSGDTSCRCHPQGQYTATQGDDCSDNNFDANPSKQEDCSTTFDDDCTDTTNDLNALNCLDFYPDEDDDQYGDQFGSPECRCVATPNFPVLDHTDCNDDVKTTHPNAEDICNSVDDNCIDGTDEGYPLKNTACDSNDTDQCTNGTYTCTTAGLGVECVNETTTDIQEVCDGANQDEDCDQESNEEGALQCEVYYADSDDDDYGDANNAKCLCGPTGIFNVQNDTDCNDGAPLIHPNRTEICGNNPDGGDGVDDNCTGGSEFDPSEDLNGPGCDTFFLDADEDTYGVATNQCACGPINFFTATNNTDCDDTKPEVHPNRDELCSTNFDDNCISGNNDENATGCSFFYLDGDNDQFGHETEKKCFCSASGDYDIADNPTNPMNTDCDDSKPAVNLNGTETCNTAYDDDCDKDTNDADSTNCTNFYRDEDGDGFGHETAFECRCQIKGDYKIEAPLNTDCNDNVFLVNPNQPERCNTAIIDDNCNDNINDENANNCTPFYKDFDNDSHGDENTASKCYCVGEGIYDATTQDDCNDANENAYGGSNPPLEACDNVDNDCNNQTDEGQDNAGCSNYWIDADEDGHGAQSDPITIDWFRCLCAPDTSGGYTATSSFIGDCNDDNDLVFPGSLDGNGITASLCNNVDNDCDNITDDAMNYSDHGVIKKHGSACGLGVCTGSTVTCNTGTGQLYCPNDPANASAEVCNNQDDDCDGSTDAQDPVDLLTNDTQNCEDQDGVCNSSTKPSALCVGGSWQSCNPLTYFQNSSSYETSESKCDQLDNDCDDLTDEGWSVGTTCLDPPGGACYNGILDCDGISSTHCVNGTPKNSGTECSNQICSAGVITPPSLCNGLGSCNSQNTVSCDGFACLSASSCRTSCGSDSHCITGFFCDGGDCVSEGAAGDPCNQNNQCATGNCTDNVCCNSSDCGECSVCAVDGNCADYTAGTDPNGDCGTCEFCNGAGDCTAAPANTDPDDDCSNCKTCNGNSTCVNVGLGADPHDDCSATPTNSCSTNGSCDGSGQCDFYDNSTTCDDDDCDGTGGTFTFNSNYVCSAPLTCTPQNTESCGGNNCDSNTGCVDCSDSGECVIGFYCSGGGTCLSQTADGGGCGANTECLSENCESGTCVACPQCLVWINEIHYNDAGGDDNEGIEIAAKAGTDLSGWTLYFYEGNDGSVDGTLSLSGVIPDLSNGYGAIWFDKSGLENGPDGIALVDDLGNVVQFLSYEGSFLGNEGPANGLTSEDIVVEEPNTTTSVQSLQLIGTGYRYIDFSWTGPTSRTNNAFSSGQTISVP